MTYKNVSDKWGDAIGGLTVADYEMQASVFVCDGEVPAVITSDDEHIYADGVVVADAEIEVKESSYWGSDGRCILTPNTETETSERSDDSSPASCSPIVRELVAALDAFVTDEEFRAKGSPNEGRFSTPGWHTRMARARAAITKANRIFSFHR